jgi:ATP-dependent helicase Lhr and Lhr-like helicase
MAMIPSTFHPTVRRWFEGRFEQPSEPQEMGWPLIRQGRHTLIAAPTGTGKTLAAFLWAIDSLIRQGEELPDATQVLYVSPLKALGNDVQKNLQGPLSELRALDSSLPEVRVLVRSGDTLPAARAAMRKRPPHILVTTPESLYILLTSQGGRAMLGAVRTVIVDEIHAMCANKRGAHLALSLERLEALTASPPQRIGLSATQKPLEEVGHLLAGSGREVALVDVGHRRTMDLAVEIPESPLSAVCSHETWDEIYRRMATLIQEHRTTLLFVNTRKLAERVAARLTEVLGKEQVTSHHGSLSRERRLDAEQRLKSGSLRALVATASLELGIDIGEVDLVIQVGVTPSIATFLQRVGRSGHALSRTPKGRIFPLTRDELVCSAALLHAVRSGDLDRTPLPRRPLDILAQQVVAACVAETWEEDALFATLTRAWPYRELSRGDFEAVVRLHSQGRLALLHRDGVQRRLRATRRARLTALTSGGAIPDYQVLLEPEGTLIGSVHEDFAVEATVGDIFQLGNASWKILKVEPGIVRVADAQGAPPSLPFWLGEAPARTEELSEAISRVRIEGQRVEWLIEAAGLTEPAARQLAEYVASGAKALGAVPSRHCIVLERFFDESGGMQLVLHSPFGGRINRAWGLALRKRFCRGFGFELQAAANEEAIVISLGPHHSFPLAEVFDYLHPGSAKDLLVQALFPSPLFLTRWRWNLTRSLLLSRTQKGGRRVPAPLLRMRADDQLVQAFPQVLACGETLPPGDLPVPWEQPIVRQTIEDCLEEAMDAEGMLNLLRDLRRGRIRRVAIDTPEPSPFALGVLNAMPYAFLDDAPLEERRTQAVLQRRSLDAASADTVGALDPDAVARVRDEAWPQPESAEEVHEALLWMGYVSSEESRQSGWHEWLEQLSHQSRVVRDGDRWFAAESSREPKAILRGRLEALGPMTPRAALEPDASMNSSGSQPFSPSPSASGALPHSRLFLSPEDEPALLALEHEGVILRCRLEGRQAWCDRRLLARIHAYTLERLRREIEPISVAAFWRFLTCWQHAEAGHRLEGPRGVAEIVQQLAGFEIPAAAWETSILPVRVRGYRPDWLDHLTLTGEVAWGRIWGTADSAIRSTPIALLPRRELEIWTAIAATSGETREQPLSGRGEVLRQWLSSRGALFSQELETLSGMLPTHFNMALSELIARGLITCDSFGGLRRLLKPSKIHRRFGSKSLVTPAGRWSLLRAAPTASQRRSPSGAVLAETGASGGTQASEAGADFDAAMRSGSPGFPSQRTGLQRESHSEFAARQLLRRYGLLQRRLLERERIPLPWRDLVRACRRLELSGEIRGGRFVSGLSGEQYALPEAIELLRSTRKLEPGHPVSVSAADPLNLQGILTPSPRVPSQSRQRIQVGS